MESRGATNYVFTSGRSFNVQRSSSCCTLLLIGPFASASASLSFLVIRLINLATLPIGSPCTTRFLWILHDPIMSSQDSPRLITVFHSQPRYSDWHFRPGKSPHFFFLIFFFILLMPGIATGITLRLPSFPFSSSPHLHQASLFTSPASPIALKHPLSSSHKDKVAYKFIVHGRWVTNPTQVNHGSINKMDPAPPKSVPP